MTHCARALLLAVSVALTGCTAADPGAAAAHVDRGDRLIATYKSNRQVIDDALASFREAVRLEPHSPAGYVGIARALGTAGDFKEELAAAEDAARRFPHDASAQFALAMALGDNDRHEEAIAAFQRAAAINPAYPQLATQLSWTYTHMGEHARAVDAGRRGTLTDPKEPFAFRQFGDALFAAGKVEEAVPAYRRAIALAPSDPWGYKRLADTLNALDRPADAAAELQAAIRRFPGDLVLALDHGVTLEKTGRRDDALAQLARAEALAVKKLAATPDDVDVINSLGVAQEYQGKLAAAADTYGRILTLAREGNVTHTTALGNLANVLTRQKKYDEAAALARRVYAASKQPADLRMCSLATFTAGRAAEALALADQWFAENDPASHMGRYFAVHAHLMALGVPDRAATAGKYLQLARAHADAGWPLPCVDYLEGKLAEPALLALATDHDKLTEARAYIGFKLLFSTTPAATAPPAATDHLRWVATHGNPHYIETTHATAWLSRQ